MHRPAILLALFLAVEAIVVIGRAPRLPELRPGTAIETPRSGIGDPPRKSA